MKNLLKLLSLTLGLGLSSLFAGTDATPTTTPPADKPKIEIPKIDPATLPDSVKALIAQFKAQRDTLSADRKAKLDQLKNLTEAERKALLDQLFAAQKALLTEHKALAKQIRDELKKLRDAKKPAAKI